MPYRLRLFSGELLISNTQHETTEGVGRQIAEYPAGEFIVDEGAGPRYEIVYLDQAGNERPATVEEDKEAFMAMADRRSEIIEQERPPCLRCGRKAEEHEHPYPVRFTPKGSIYFDCWTDEERNRGQ